MKHKSGILFFSVIEIFIGIITLAAVSLSLIQGKSTKPLEILIFVIVTAIISLSLGLGILKYNRTSYHLLIYFASVIILSKILIFANIIKLNGTLETSIPSDLKNIISVLYHSLLIFYFTRKPIIAQFNKTSS